MNTAARKDAIRRFKEREPERGVFAVRCADGGIWVGSSTNLAAAKNGLWFALRQHAHRDRALQAAWLAHGEARFAFEVLGTIPADTAALNVSDALKAKKREWMARLDAAELLP